MGVCLLSRRVCGAKMIEDELREPTRDKPGRTDKRTETGRRRVGKDGQMDGNRMRMRGMSTSDEAERGMDGQLRPTQKAET